MGKWHLWANELGNHTDPKNSFVPEGPYRLGLTGCGKHITSTMIIMKAITIRTHRQKNYYGGFEPDIQTDRAIEYISTRESGNPFFLFLSFDTPHDPWEESNVPGEFYDLFRNTEFQLPPNYSDELDPFGDEWSNIDKSPENVRDWMRVYYSMTANLGRNFGRILKAVEEKGVEEETVIIFTSDHGEMFGAHGRMKKYTFYEEA